MLRNTTAVSAASTALADATCASFCRFGVVPTIKSGINYSNPDMPLVVDRVIVYSFERITPLY